MSIVSSEPPVPLKTDKVAIGNLHNNPDFHGGLISLQVRPTDGKEGVQLLEIRAGDDKYKNTRHFLLTDTLQLWNEMNRIRGILHPTLEDATLAELKKIRKLMEQNQG